MEPLAFGSPANDKIPSTTALHIMREAEEVERVPGELVISSCKQ
jgi:hypothetical protein